MADASLAGESLADFAAALAAREPVPGGGGAAAYVGALAAALCSMVGEFTRGKRRYERYERDIQGMLETAEATRARLVQLVDEDAEAFLPLAQAYASPKGDPARADAIERATKGATQAPHEMMRQVCDTIELLEEMGQKGSRMLLSDVGCGALLARAALEAASLNVFVNTRSLQDRAWAGRLDADCDRMLDEYSPRAERLAREVMDRVRAEG
ncbi:MAG: cyclodeaminase/cyclohydrolase family protein [Acidobacteriota bacterium]|nr:cyclodeaminase/cyclohydrolase family protein [Acidobacteriota bacterium]